MGYFTVDPPGNVGNVSLSVSSFDRVELMNFFQDPNFKSLSPLAVYLHIHWRPPVDLGSHGFVHHYIVRSGRAMRFTIIPPSFTEEPKVKEAPNVSLMV